MSDNCENKGTPLKRPIQENRMLQYSDIRFVVDGEPLSQEVLNRALYDLTYEITQKYHDRNTLGSPSGASLIGVDHENLTNLQQMVTRLDNNAILKSRRINTGNGLTGGGDLSQDRTISVDSTVVRTNADQVITGKKTFNVAPSITGPMNGSLSIVNRGFVSQMFQATREGLVETSRKINTSGGVIGGGTLGEDLELKLDTSFVRGLIEPEVDAKIQAAVSSIVNSAIAAAIAPECQDDGD